MTSLLGFILWIEMTICSDIILEIFVDLKGASAPLFFLFIYLKIRAGRPANHSCSASVDKLSTTLISI